MSFSWIKEILVRAYPQADWSRGVDLNENGRLEKEERLDDFDGDGVVGNPKDWEIYFLNHRTDLQKRITFFRVAGEHSLLSLTNPIHDVLAIEAEIKPYSTKSAYRFVTRCLKRIRAILDDKKLREEYRSKIEAKIAKATSNPYAWQIVLIYDELKKMGIQFKNSDNPLLSEDIDWGKILDCDTASFIVRAVAHELGLLLTFVQAPQHLFLRWNGKGKKFNIDLGDIFSDDFYIKKFGIKKDWIANGVYLKSLSSEEAIGSYFHNRANANHMKRNNHAAIADCDKAIQLNAKFADAVKFCADVHNWIGDCGGVIVYYNRLIKLLPGAVNLFLNRGRAKECTGNKPGALADYEEAIKIDPANREAIFSINRIKKSEESTL